MRILMNFLSAWLLFLGFQVQGQHKTNVTKQMTHNNTPLKVLMVVTSFSEVTGAGKKTGIWMEELAVPYYQFTGKGIAVTIASPAGGKAPADPKSLAATFATPEVTRFLKDPAALALLEHTIPLAAVEAGAYDAIFYPGGHGPMWDLPDNTASIQLISDFYRAGKPVGLVCHAPAALKNVMDAGGQPLVKGKQVAGFSNSEEVAGQTTDVVPFLLEDMLKEKGAIYIKGPDWQPFAVASGNLITGQNPASALVVAQKVLAALKGKR